MKQTTATILILTVLTSTLIGYVPNNAVAQQENTWELQIPKTQLDQVYGAVGAGDKIYIYQDSFFCYDPSTGIRTEKAHLEIPSLDSIRKGDDCVYTVVTLQNEIYVIGGVDSVWQNKHFTFIRIYNITDDSWKNGTATDYDIEYFPKANAVDGKIYLLDGRSGHLGVFDPIANSWTAKTPLPFWYLFSEEQDPLIDQTCVINDRIYCFTFSRSNSPTRTIIYDTKTDTWLSGADPPSFDLQASYYTVACATTGNFAPQRIYYMGTALFPQTDLNFNYVYDPANDSWSTAKPLLNSSLSYYTSTVLNDKLYYFAINGREVEVYTPMGYSTTPLSPSPSPTYPQVNPMPKINPVVYTKVAIAVIIGVSFLLATLFLRRSKPKKALPNNKLR
jgi:N-acetylneuraminic acid mutarotase